MKTTEMLETQAQPIPDWEGEGAPSAAPAPPARRKPTGGGILLAAIKYKFRMLFVMIIGVAIAFVAVKERPKVFSSTAMLVIKYNSTKQVGDNPDRSVGSDGRTGSYEYLLAQNAFLESPDFHRDVAEFLLEEWRAAGRKIENEEIPEKGTEEWDREAALQAYIIGGSLQVTRREALRSPIIRLKFLHEDPDAAQEYLQVVVKTYQQTLGTSPELEKAIKFGEDQLKLAKDALAKIEARRLKLGFDSGVHDVPKEIPAILGIVSKLELEIPAETSALRRDRLKLEALVRQHGDMKDVIQVAPVTVPNPEIAAIRQALSQAQAELAKTVFKEGTLEYEQLEGQVSKLEAAMAKSNPILTVQPDPAPNLEKERLGQEIELLRVEATGREMKLADMKEQLTDARERLKKMKGLIEPFEKLERGLANEMERVSRADLRLDLLYRQKYLLEADFFQDQAVLQRASRPYTPDGKPGIMLFAIGVAASLAAGLGVGALSGVLDKSILSPGDLIRLLPDEHLATIPDLRGRRQLRRTQKLHRTSRSETVAWEWPDALASVPNYSARQGDRTVLTDQVDLAFSRLGIQPGRRAGQTPVVGFGSPRGGSGVTTFVFNSALHLWYKHGMRALVVDWNLRATEFVDAFGPARTPTPILGSDGPSIIVGQETGTSIEEVIDLHAADFDVVLIDCEPILQYGETVAVLSTVRDFVLVVAAGIDSRVDIEIAREFVEQSGSVVRGAILTRRRFYSPEFLGLDGPV